MSERNAQPQQQRNAAGPVPPQVYCGFSRHKLYELLEKYIENPRMYECFFFNVYEKLGPFQKRRTTFHLESDDDFDRCTKCGRTISEHPTAEQQQRRQAEYERRRNLGEIPD